jgi:hypothetical protein
MSSKGNKSQQHPTLTGAEILCATLAAEGTTTVFGYPGGLFYTCPNSVSSANQGAISE